MIRLNNKQGQLQAVFAWLLFIFLLVFLFSGGFKSFFNISRALLSVPVWVWVVLIFIWILGIAGRKK